MTSNRLDRGSHRDPEHRVEHVQAGELVLGDLASLRLDARLDELTLLAGDLAKRVCGEPLEVAQRAERGFVQENVSSDVSARTSRR
jgi:hypothetical protein